MAVSNAARTPDGSDVSSAHRRNTILDLRMRLMPDPSPHRSSAAIVGLHVGRQDHPHLIVQHTNILAPEVCPAARHHRHRAAETFFFGGSSLTAVNTNMTALLMEHR
jgi:hypothetical protein